MNTDYKFWFIRRDNDGFITEAAIRFYEGDYKMLAHPDTGAPVSTYVRSKRLDRADMAHLKGEKFARESNGKGAVIYDTKDFGAIKMDDELRAFLNSELARDPNRMPIVEQR